VQLLKKFLNVLNLDVIRIGLVGVRVDVGLAGEVDDVGGSRRTQTLFNLKIKTNKRIFNKEIDILKSKNN
jgi:hypothetical protein